MKRFVVGRVALRCFEGGLATEISMSLAYSLMLVGGFNPSEKYESNWIISPGRGIKIKNI